MKIEKLTENKIRVILKQNDFKDKNINISNIILTKPNYNNFFLDILEKAKEEVDFDWTGHKLIIESFSESDDIFVFTITKYLNSQNYLYIKKKNSNIVNSYITYKFQTFEHFCEFCNFLNTLNLELKKLFKSSFLYFYNDEYYLTIKNSNIESNNLHIFNFSLLEFATQVNNSKNFYLKLEEHAKKIFKNNAIYYGIKFFAQNRN